jgi:hypothetical protein
MRALLLSMALQAAALGQSAASGAGTWKMDAARSTFSGRAQPKSFTVRIEPHAKGEVFTLDWIEGDGRSISSSTILYSDGAARDFQDFECSGTQASRRVDSRTVEILRKCGDGGWTRFVRRSSGKPKEVGMEIEITGQRADGHRWERRLVLQKTNP